MIRFIDIDGVTIRCAIDGPSGAPAVLLIHSLGTSLDLWDAQVAELARSHRVIRFDLRGHGGSELGSITPNLIDRLAADGLAVLDALAIQCADVAGISIGGVIAMATAAMAPERVRSLILVGTSFAWAPPALWQERAALVRRDGLGAVVEGTVERWVSPAWATSPAVPARPAMFLRTQDEGYARAGEALATADMTAAAARFTMPTTVIVGELDPSAPVERSRAIHEAIAGSRLVVIPGGYHLPLGEHASAVNRAIAEHLHAGLVADGVTTRSEVLGADHVARATAAITDLDRDFQAFLTRTAWGEVWARPHFDRRTRSIVTIAILAALGRDGELELHLRAIRNTGATPADVSELLLHVAVYAGIPAANAAMRIAKRVLAEAP